MKNVRLAFSLTSLVLFATCDDDFEVRTEFIYYNSLGQEILIDDYGLLQIGPIEPGKSETIISQLPYKGRPVVAEDLMAPLLEAIVFYGEHLCDTLDRGKPAGTGESILNVRNYETTQLGKENFRFEYTFTKDDLLKADSCR